MRLALLVALMALAISSSAAAEKAPPVQDHVQYYGDSDERMNSAIANARAQLPRFFEVFDGAPAASREAFALKVGLDTPNGGREHIWVGSLRRERGQLVGELADVPENLPGMQLGSRLVIEPDRISDWMIHTPQGIYGGYTMRVMIDDLPEAEARQYRELLAPTLLPEGWAP